MRTERRVSPCSPRWGFSRPVVPCAAGREEVGGVESLRGSAVSPEGPLPLVLGLGSVPRPSPCFVGFVGVSNFRRRLLFIPLNPPPPPPALKAPCLFSPSNPHRQQTSVLSGGSPGRTRTAPPPEPPGAEAEGKGSEPLLGGPESPGRAERCLGEAGRIMAPNDGAGWLHSRDLHGTLFLSVQRGSFFTPRCLKEAFIYLLGEAWRTPAITEH